MISEIATRAWTEWIKVTRARCHLHFEMDGGNLSEHVRIGREVGLGCARTVAGDLASVPEAILEVGSSVGFNCLGLAERNPWSKVVGIEPDGEACDVATAMAADFGLSNAYFINGVGERLPFPDESFDWIVCHTVIEHVGDVDACIREMARVLRPGGYLHLDAPNYIWPWEPHLRVLMPPLCPKPLLRILARAQGAAANVDYADHLKFVHPAWIERCFRRFGLTWVNRVEEKLRRAAMGNREDVVAHRKAAMFLHMLQLAGLADLLIRMLIGLRLYPSLLYTARKPLPDSATA